MDAMAKEQTAPVLAAKLNNLMMARGTKQVDLARDLYVSPQAVSRWLAGAGPRPQALVGVANFFGVDPVWLADEQRPWIDPPPGPGGSLSDEALMDEVKRRYHATAEQARDLIGEAEAIDWGYVAEEGFFQHKVWSGMFADLDAAAEVAALLSHLPVVLEQFDTGMIHRKDLVAKWPLQAAPESVKLFHLQSRINAILDRLTADEETARSFRDYVLREGQRALKRSSILGRLRGALDRYREAGGRYVQADEG